MSENRKRKLSTDELKPPPSKKARPNEKSLDSDDEKDLLEGDAFSADSKVTVSINGSTKVFQVGQIKWIPFFQARLSKRWNPPTQNKSPSPTQRKVPEIIIKSSEILLDHLETLVSIHQKATASNQIPTLYISPKMTLSNICSLLGTMQYLGLDSQINTIKKPWELERSLSKSVKLTELVNLPKKYKNHFSQAKEVPPKSRNHIMEAFVLIEDFIEKEKDEVRVKVCVNDGSKLFGETYLKKLRFFEERLRELWKRPPSDPHFTITIDDARFSLGSLSTVLYSDRRDMVFSETDSFSYGTYQV